MRRRWSVAAVFVGVALLAGSVGFRLVAVPALVRFPLNIDETTHYTGTSVSYVDPATLLPLTPAKREPLSLTRHVKVVDGDYGHAVIVESVRIHAGSTTSIEKYQYVMDRRSMKFVDDPRQFAFGNPKATMKHATGAYRVNFALGTDADGKYRSYIPEADRSTPLVLAEDRHYHADAHVSVIDFTSKLEAPVAPYYRAHLAAMGLPMHVTVTQLQPQLQAAGIDVNRALADVLPRLTPDESKLLSATLARPVALQYFFFADGLVSIEPKTGALIDVHAQREGVSVRPDLSGVATLQPLLDKYAAIPSVKSLSDGLAVLAARRPQVAQELRYRQTVPSSLRAADKARSQGRQMTVVTWWVPGAMAFVGLLLLVLGLIGWRRAGPRHPAAPVPNGPVTPDTAPEREPQTV